MDKKRLLEPTGMDVGEFLAALTEYEACYPDDRRVEIARGWAIWRAATPTGWEPDDPEQALQHKKLHSQRCVRARVKGHRPALAGHRPEENATR